MHFNNSFETIFTQELVLNSDKHSLPIGLDITFKKDGNQKPLILFIHGFKGFKDWGHFHLIANDFAQKGFIFSKINLSHNGTTPTHKKEFVNLEAFSKQTYTKDLHDITTVIDYFFSSDYNLKNITNLNQLYLIGHSRGGALALLQAAKDARIKKVVTWASISNTQFLFTPERLKELAQNQVIYIENARTKQKMPIRYEVYEDLIQNEHSLNLEKQVSQIQVPIMIIHGQNDTSVSMNSAYQLQSWAQNAKLIIIENADHTFGGKEPYTEPTLPPHTVELINHTINFLLHNN